MVDAFVRSHVNIQILLNEPIELHSIVLNSKVNSQISCGFIISSSIVAASASTSSPLDLNSFKQISKLINDKNKSCYLYEFVRRNSTSQDDDDTNVNRAYFSVGNQDYLNRLTAINIRIVKTLNSTNCCMKSLEINGYLTNSKKNANTTKQSHEITSANKKSDEIPSEFIDDITQEMIRVPVRLPSSKIIDKSTLDRYVAEQKVLKDPFTNLPIDDKSKLVLDDKLKTKIDRYILDKQILSLPTNSSSNNNKRSLTTESVENSATTSKKAKLNDLNCMCCLNPKSSSKHLFRLETCEHLFCRECIRNLNKTCLVCKKTFENKQINRIY